MGYRKKDEILRKDNIEKALLKEESFKVSAINLFQECFQ